MIAKSLDTHVPERRVGLNKQRFTQADPDFVDDEILARKVGDLEILACCDGIRMFPQTIAKRIGIQAADFRISFSRTSRHRFAHVNGVAGSSAVQLLERSVRREISRVV